MDFSNAYQMFSNLDIQVATRSYEKAKANLAIINNDLYLSFCIPNSKEYNVNFNQFTAFYFTLDLCKHDNPILSEEAKHFIHRWSYLISSISPADLFTDIQNLLQKSEAYSEYLHFFMPAIGNAISLLSDDEILHNFSIIQKTFKYVLAGKQSEIPKPVWQVIGKYSPENDIAQILQKNLEIQFASIAPDLIQKNPKKFTNLLFQQASSDYLNELINNCPDGYRIDVDEALNKSERDCDKLGTAGFNSTCQFLGNIIRYYIYDFTEEQQTRIKNILTKMHTFLSDPKITVSDTNSIFLTLYEGSRKNLFEKVLLKKFLPQIKFSDECPELQITYLKVTIFCMEKDGDNTIANNALLQFYPWFDQIYIQYLAVIEENFLFLKEMNPNLVVHILWSIFHPLPIEQPLAVDIVKFLLKMDPTDVLDPRVDARLDQLFDTYFRIDKDELSQLTLELAKLYKYSPPVTKVDLFGKFNENHISLLTSVDPNLIKEIIFSHIIEPSKRHVFLTVVQNCPKCYPELAVPIINLLYAVCKVLGLASEIDSLFSRCGLQRAELKEDIISFDELCSLYAKIDGPIEKSGFGLLLGAALDAFSVICTDTQNRQKVHQNHVAKAALMAAFLIHICPKQVLNLLASLQSYRLKEKKSVSGQKSSETNSAAKSYTEAFRIVKSARIPIKYSIDVVSYANVLYDGYNEAVKQFPKHINDALSKSRAIADLFKESVKQPLQPLKTFLSFFGVKEHEEWVSICQQVIPPNEWILEASDENTIEEFQNLSEEQRRIVMNKLESLKSMTKSVSQARESYDNRAEFIRLKSPLRILPGPKVHPHDNKSVKPGTINITQLQPPNTTQEAQNTAETDEQNENNEQNESLENNVDEDENESVNVSEEAAGDGALFDLISFLWHSNMDLPESVKMEDLEAAALANPRNPKMLAGFFSWANSHSYKIDLHKWEQKILVKRYTPLWMFAIAMFASNIHCPFDEIPPSIVQVLQKCLTSFGYPAITKSSLAHGYYHLSGVKWLLVRNIISIDPSYFNEYPLIIIELTQNMDMFKKYFDELDVNDYNKVNFDSFVGINNILFRPSKDELIQSSLIPTNRTFHDKIYTFKEISQIPKQLEIPNELLESIINALQKAKSVSYVYFAFFMNIKMTNEQFLRIHDIFFKDKKNDMMRKFMLPSLFVSETGKSAYMQDEAIRFYSNKPPSLTRAFFRSLLCRFAPPVNQDLIKKIQSISLKVFPELCYCGFAKNGIRMWQDSLALSKLRFGFIDNNIGSSLLNDMKVPCKEAIIIYMLLVALPDNELAIAQPWATKGMIRDEISRVLLETATSDCSVASFATTATELVCDTIGAESAMILIANKEFFKKKNFICAIMALKVLLRKAQEKNNQNVVEFVKMLQNPETKLIEDEDKMKIFANLNDDDSISQLIHPSS